MQTFLKRILRLNYVHEPLMEYSFCAGIRFTQARPSAHFATVLGVPFALYYANTRVHLRANGTTAVHLKEMHYYLFGMLIEGLYLLVDD